MFLINLLIPILLMSTPTDSIPDNPLTKKGATLQKLSGEFSFTEGPTSDAEGNVYFTDQPNDRIMKWSVDGQLTTYMQPAGRSNGMFFDHKDRLWSCADADNELWIIDKDKKKETLVVKEYEGKRLNGPNDVWVTKKGVAYITDPFYKRDWWKHTEQAIDIQGVYLVSKDHKTLTRVIDDFEKPNGIVGTPDNKKLYVSDIGAGKIYHYKINKDGSLSEKTLLCEERSDGMTIDEKGNVYITNSNGVTAYSPEGKKIVTIPTGEGWTANVCFGGKNHSTLFITASKGFYSIEMNVQGVKP
ncbi:SMP-30/gluconolactonase/LRE family protein [Persicitalea sp.]|uniref:SMP-30/gluconolactonase/LRE family protein n=1 Tax=Persicitalea sp. TaxID=3100273 RepID=UPI0035948D22